MNESKRLIRAAAVVTLAVLAPALATAQQGATKPPSAPPAAPPLRIQFQSDSLMECHFYLKTWSKRSLAPDARSGVDFATEVGVYQRAKGTLSGPEVWRWFEEVVAGGPDPAAVRKGVQAVPAHLASDRVRTGVNMLMDGLESAYPKFMKAIWPQHQRSVNRILIGARRQFLRSEERITRVLMEKMAFSPIDAPVRVITVLRSGGVTSWGKTPKGYFTVVGILGQSQNSLLEIGIHEATHLVQTMQPFNTASILKHLRGSLIKKGPAETEAFLHGLVAYNAGALIKRFISSSYEPEGVRSPAHEREYRPYLSTYEYIWNEYLDGRMNRDQIIAKLIEEFEAILDLEKAKKKAAPAS